MRDSIWIYSNPTQVKKLVQKYYGKNTQLYRSTRKDKKYMIQNLQGVWIHFGQMGYEDYTKHKDKDRRKRFRQRNYNWQYALKYTPAHLSWYTLW
jgi:hypothetical protein